MCLVLAGAKWSQQVTECGSLQLQRWTHAHDKANFPDVVRQDFTEHTEATQKELLLAALLKANKELTDMWWQHNDLEHVSIECDTKEQSKKEIWIDGSVSLTILPLYKYWFSSSNCIMMQTAKCTSSHHNHILVWCPHTMHMPPPLFTLSIMAHSAQLHYSCLLSSVSVHLFTLLHSPGSFHTNFKTSFIPPPSAPHSPHQSLHLMTQHAHTHCCYSAVL